MPRVQALASSTTKMYMYYGVDCHENFHQPLITWFPRHRTRDSTYAYTLARTGLTLADRDQHLHLDRDIDLYRLPAVDGYYRLTCIVRR